MSILRKLSTRVRRVLKSGLAHAVERQDADQDNVLEWVQHRERMGRVQRRVMDTIHGVKVDRTVVGCSTAADPNVHEGHDPTLFDPADTVPCECPCGDCAERTSNRPPICRECDIDCVCGSDLALLIKTRKFKEDWTAARDAESRGWGRVCEHCGFNFGWGAGTMHSQWCQGRTQTVPPTEEHGDDIDPECQNTEPCEYPNFEVLDAERMDGVQWICPTTEERSAWHGPWEMKTDRRKSGTMIVRWLSSGLPVYRPVRNLLGWPDSEES